MVLFGEVLKYRLIAATIVSTLLAAGCASVQSSNPRSVTVRAGAMMADKAQAQADAECAKHGRHASPKGKLSAMEFVYDCVE